MTIMAVILVGSRAVFYSIIRPLFSIRDDDLATPVASSRSTSKVPRRAKLCKVPFLCGSSTYALIKGYRYVDPQLKTSLSLEYYIRCHVLVSFPIQLHTNEPVINW